MNFKEYEKYLKETKRLSDSTAETYIKRLKYYANGGKLSDKSKNYINQTKRAVECFLNSQDEYYNDEVKELRKLHKKARHVKYKSKTPLNLKKTNLKINALKDKRKKLAYRFQQISGLRISEISALEKKDIKFLDNYRIVVNVRLGKGNKQRKLKTLKDKYVWNELQKLEPRSDNKLFHKESTLRNKAWKLKFKTHKLRKVLPICLNNKYMAKNENERRELIHKLLGHEIPKNKNRYDKLYKIYTDENEVDLTGTKFDI